MKPKTKYIKTILVIFCFSFISSSGSSAQDHQDMVTGNLIQFTDNGTWCWFQDERAVVDTEKDNMLIGSVSSGSGPGGWPIDADINTTIFNLKTMTPQKYRLKRGGGEAFFCDDHNCPALLVRPDGKYIAMYAAHFNDTCSYYRIYDLDEWGPEQKFDWNEEIAGGSNFQTTYSNLLYLSSEGRTYNFARTNNRSPNSMISSDMGDTWSYGGQLTEGSFVGYNNGYYKYSSNGIDRIDFICTEYHPRDYNTSVFHGYIKGGKSYKSDGTLVDDNILDAISIPVAGDFTTLFAAGTVINGMTMNRCWNIDLQRYDDGSIAAIVSARINNNENGGDSSINPDHAFIYCRYNGTGWSYTYLGQAGLKLLTSEQDYTGLAALHPNDPNTIYISTTIDPRDNADLGVHEIFKGITNDHGVTWEWSPITQNSVRDNLRPIIPAWDEQHTALLWFRGSFVYAEIIFDAAVVGIIENEEETIGQMTYVDASTTNTLLASGQPLEHTGPSSEQGPADNKWHIRSGFANGNDVFTSGESGGEDAPVIKTELNLTDEGTYDIWANFWANPEFDWRIKAGLSEENMQLFRQMACKQVEEGDHNSEIIISDAGNTFLYQAYLGRIQASSNYLLTVFIDDETIETGTSGTMIGNTARTWYDGISYAKVEKPDAITNLVVNGDFSDGETGWQLYVDNAASASGAVINGEYKVSINDSGTETYHIQLRHPDLLIEQGKTYSVSFDAFASSLCDIRSFVQHSESPWTDYSGEMIFSLTTASRKFTHEFTMDDPTDTEAEITFHLGLSSADVTFDNIIIQETTTSVDPDNEETYTAGSFRLMQNYPNPFNPNTTIQYKLPRPAYMKLTVYDLSGKIVRQLDAGARSAGYHTVMWNGCNESGNPVASGVYFLHIQANEPGAGKRLFNDVKKMIMMK